MDPNNKLAKIVGGLFIIGTVAGILSVIFTGSIIDNPNYLTEATVNESQIIIGSLFVLIMAFSLAMIPVVLFPIFKKYNETLALGAVVFRGVLETVSYIAIVISWLVLIMLSQEYIKAGAPDASALQTLGSLLLGVGDWTNQILGIVFSLGAMMIYYLFYISKLVPRWLSIWGLAGAAMYLAAPLLSLFGSKLDILMTPLALQEIVLAVWLIVKGFSPTAVTPSLTKQVSKA